MVDAFAASRSDRSGLEQQLQTDSGSDTVGIGTTEKVLLGLCAVVIGSVPVFLILNRDYGL
jgi:hypothetical protein